jgi:hypothetical protein
MKLSKEETTSTLLDAKYFLNMAIKNIMFSRHELAKNIDFKENFDLTTDCKITDIYLSTCFHGITKQIEKIDSILETLK